MPRIDSLIPSFVRRAIARILETFTPSNSTVPTRWLRMPNLDEGDEVCVFVSYAPENVLPRHSLFHARAWGNAGFKVIIVLNSNSYDSDVALNDLGFASGLLIRENRGYDFGAWASALRQLPDIRGASLVSLANDSMYGPLDTFGTLLERVRSSDADVIGATESRQQGRHFQSFLMFFRPPALRNDIFWRFWEDIRAGGRIIAIYRYELRLLKTLERAGLRCTALFASKDRRNPTLTRWKQLIEEGLPYVKVALLRDNYFKADLSDWQDIMRKRGYDPELVMRQGTSRNS